MTQELARRVEVFDACYIILIFIRVLEGVRWQILLLCLTFASPGRPSRARYDTLVPPSHAPTSVPSEHSESLPGERDFEWQDYNYDGDVGDKGQAPGP